MKILLAVSMSEERFNGIPDLGLGYLASYARQSGHRVHYLDCLMQHIAWDEYRVQLRQCAPDMVGIKVFSCDIGPARRMMEIAREELPQAKLIIGGPHPSCASAGEIGRASCRERG